MIRTVSPSGKNKIMETVNRSVASRSGVEGKGTVVGIKRWSTEYF